MRRGRKEINNYGGRNDPSSGVGAVYIRDGEHRGVCSSPNPIIMEINSFLGCSGQIRSAELAAN